MNQPLYRDEFGVIRDQNGNAVTILETPNHTRYDAQSGRPDPNSGPDPREEIRRQAQAIIDRGGQFDKAAGFMVRQLAGRAIAGDKRVLAIDHSEEFTEWQQFRREKADAEQAP
jgi:hypothetical protein